MSYSRAAISDFLRRSWSFEQTAGPFVLDAANDEELNALAVARREYVGASQNEIEPDEFARCLIASEYRLDAVAFTGSERAYLSLAAKTGCDIQTIHSVDQWWRRATYAGNDPVS